MKYTQEILACHDNPSNLEILYQNARGNNELEQFRDSVLTCYQSAPNNLLYAAWHHRLQNQSNKKTAASHIINWKLAILLAIVNGLILWLCSNISLDDSDFPHYLALFSAPCTAVFMIAYLSISSKQFRTKAVVLQIVILLIIAAYSLLLLSESSGYFEIMVPHLIALSWGTIAIGIINVVSYSTRSRRKNFLFLISSIETIITLGLFVAATFIFSAVTISIFSVINITLSDSITRLVLVGIGGAMPILALAASYNPILDPTKQEFSRGISWLIGTFPPILLALTLPVLVVYLALIPSNFMEAFNNRDVLITYNVMLFAIMLLLLVSTPIETSHKQTPANRMLRLAIIAIASLTIIVSFYALAAVIYRTVIFGLTINRATVIGWNAINISLLCIMVFRQVRCTKDEWITALQSTFSDGIFIYLIWASLVITISPWQFSR